MVARRVLSHPAAFRSSLPFESYAAAFDRRSPCQVWPPYSSVETGSILDQQAVDRKLAVVVAVGRMQVVGAAAVGILAEMLAAGHLQPYQE